VTYHLESKQLVSKLGLHYNLCIISKEKEIPKWEALSEAYDQLGMAK